MLYSAPEVGWQRAIRLKLTKEALWAMINGGLSRLPPGNVKSWEAANSTLTPIQPKPSDRFTGSPIFFSKGEISWETVTVPPNGAEGC